MYGVDGYRLFQAGRGTGGGRRWRRTLLISCLLLLASCSSIQFAYNQLDRWMRWQIDDYVDFNDRQELMLRQSLDQFHIWHRRTQLPRYADSLEELAARVDSRDFGPEDLPAVEAQLEEFWETSSAQLYDLLLPLSATLTRDQVRELAQEMREKREESLEKWQKSPEKIEQKRRKRIRKQSERWLGSLNDEQEQLISAWVHQVAYNPLLRDQQRQKWQAAFLDLLWRRPEGYQEKLRDLIDNPQQLWSAEYRQLQEERQRRARQLGEKIFATITDRQRNHLTRTLREYARDFRTLSAQ
ncbi:DUF6279 family lipoprotein [Microbulbifer sp. YPW16]|uniref:DUF6279 family lipoprotein n=1 Tax=Microbulbifer sp. YPW16 TaxID=2904242 RepID=UPI001E396217|nr:DUF6279 family lipoprotein [Microbulbifer sp. YPW16]UHQ56416.1 DUF6279 family lipoprotein [Microbulbifer sp. YPW16]